MVPALTRLRQLRFRNAVGTRSGSLRRSPAIDRPQHVDGREDRLVGLERAEPEGVEEDSRRPAQRRVAPDQLFEAIALVGAERFRGGLEVGGEPIPAKRTLDGLRQVTAVPAGLDERAVAADKKGRGPR